MSFTLNQLEVFVLTTKCGSFSAAARKARKAQSAISSAIANLEIELGLELFDRSSKIPVLTIEGRAFLDAAESFLRQSRSLDELANALSLGLEHRIDLVADDAVPQKLLYNSFAALEKQYPQVQLNLMHPVDERSLDFLSDGRAGLALTITEPNYGPDISFRRLGDVALANVAPSGHPLSKLKVVKFSELHSHRQLVYAPHAKKLPTGEYLQSGHSWFFNSYGLIVELLREGLGWAVCPKHLIARELTEGSLRELKLEAYPVTDWLVGLDMVWINTRKQGVATTWLKDFFVKAPKVDLDNTTAGQARPQA